MGLEWIVLSGAVAFESLLLLVVTLPLPKSVSKTIVDLYRRMLRPLMAIVPFALFQLLDVYWKYEHRIPCGSECTTLDRDRFEKASNKSQRNGILALSALFMYWMLIRYVQHINELVQLETKVESVKQE